MVALHGLDEEHRDDRAQPHRRQGEHDRANELSGETAEGSFHISKCGKQDEQRFEVHGRLLRAYNWLCLLRVANRGEEGRTNVKRLLAGMVLLGLANAGAQVASFDCKAATTPAEKAVCASPDLGEADKRMAAAYRRALRPLSSRAAEMMRVDQRRWLGWLATVCKADGTADEQKLAYCMIGAYRAREEDLAAAVRTRPEGVFFTRSVFLAYAEDNQPSPSGTEFPGSGIVRARWLQIDKDDENWPAWNAAMERGRFGRSEQRVRGTTIPPRDRTPNFR